MVAAIEIPKNFEASRFVIDDEKLWIAPASLETVTISPVSGNFKTSKDSLVEIRGTVEAKAWTLAQILNISNW